MDGIHWFNLLSLWVLLLLRDNIVLYVHIPLNRGELYFQLAIWAIIKFQDTLPRCELHHSLLLWELNWVRQELGRCSVYWSMDRHLYLSPQDNTRHEEGLRSWEIFCWSSLVQGVSQVYLQHHNNLDCLLIQGQRWRFIILDLLDYCWNSVYQLCLHLRYSLWLELDSELLLLWEGYEIKKNLRGRWSQSLYLNDASKFGFEGGLVVHYFNWLCHFSIFLSSGFRLSGCYFGDNKERDMEFRFYREITCSSLWELRLHGEWQFNWEQCD